jgi:hypothetical protein
MLGLLFTYISPFIIVYLNHAVLTEGGVDVDTVGLIIILATFIGIVRYIEHKVKVFEIQDKKKMFLIVWSGMKRIGLTIGVWWLLITIEANIDDLILTVQLLTTTFILGFIFTVLGNRNIKKATN